MRAETARSIRAQDFEDCGCVGQVRDSDVGVEIAYGWVSAAASSDQHALDPSRTRAAQITLRIADDPDLVQSIRFAADLAHAVQADWNEAVSFRMVGSVCTDLHVKVRIEPEGSNLAKGIRKDVPGHDGLP